MAAPADPSAADAQRAVADLAAKIGAVYRVNCEIASRIEEGLFLASQAYYFWPMNAKEIGSAEVEAAFGGRKEGLESALLYRVQPRGTFGHFSELFEGSVTLQAFSESSVVLKMKKRRYPWCEHGEPITTYHSLTAWNTALHEVSESLGELRSEVALAELRVCLANLETLQVALGALEARALTEPDEASRVDELVPLVRELNALLAALQTQAGPGHELVLPSRRGAGFRDIWDVDAWGDEQRRLLRLSSSVTLVRNKFEQHGAIGACGLMRFKECKVQWTLEFETPYCNGGNACVGIVSEADLSTPVVEWSVDELALARPFYWRNDCPVRVVLTVEPEKRTVEVQVMGDHTQHKSFSGVGTFRLYVSLRSGDVSASVRKTQCTVAPAAEEVAPKPEPVCGAKRPFQDSGAM